MEPATTVTAFGPAPGPEQPRWSYDYQYRERVDAGTPLARCKQWISSFLCFCAGADPQILRLCPHSERVKEQGIGGVVLATATLAFCSGTYAFYTVFSPKRGFALSHVQQDAPWWAYALAVVFGLLWALMIFNLDRFIVSSAGHGDGTEKITRDEVVRALPRLLMAVMIGLVLSKPLEIRIMESEINAKLTEAQQEFATALQKKDDIEFDKLRKELDERKAATKAKLDAKQREVSDLAQAIAEQRAKVDAEADGSSGSGKAGEGKAYHAKVKNLDEMKVSLDAARATNGPEIKALEAEIADLNRQISQWVEQRADSVETNKKKAASQDGLIQRIKLAHEIAPLASWMLTGLLIVLEIAPIFFKMMVSIGPYDYLSENVRRMTIAARGIELKEQIDGKESVELKDAVYYEADTALEHEIGKLQVERQLTKVAYDEYQARVARDIKKNPEKYQVGEPTTPALPT